MSGYTYTDVALLSPETIGLPKARVFESSSTALSASSDTVVDFTPATGSQLNCPGVPVGCGFQVVDATSGNPVDYSARVTIDMPNTSNVGQWFFQLVIPPVAGAPSVIVYAYLTYFPFVSIDTL